MLTCCRCWCWTRHHLRTDRRRSGCAELVVKPVGLAGAQTQGSPARTGAPSPMAHSPDFPPFRQEQSRMSVIVGTTTSAFDQVVSVALDDHERRAVQWLTARLAAGPSTMVDHPESVDRARELSCALPLALRESLRRFRRDPGPEGVLIVRGLPIAGHSLPSTPTRSGSVQRTVAEASSALVLTSLQLGEVVAFRGEKDGALVQNVVPVPGREDFQGNAGSVRLHMHVENAFHPNQPDYVVLLCLRNDHDDLAGLQTAS